MKRRGFGVVHSFFGLLSSSSTGLIVGAVPPTRPLPGHQPIEQSERDPEINISVLPNGVRIITESAKFPSNVTIGIAVETGPRDEDMEHAGVCFALKNTFLKTNTRTNEQLNYCIVQMSGGEVSMSYDQDSLFYTGTCLAHDTYDFLQLMSDILLDDKTVIDEEAAHWRADEYWKLRNYSPSHDRTIQENWLTVAYGTKTLGMPLAGFQSRFQAIGYSHINEFRAQFATPDRMVISATGIRHHVEFVTAITPYFLHLKPVNPKPHEPAHYIGGELREVSEDSHTTFHLSFQAPMKTLSETLAMQVLLKVVGDTGNPKSLNRAWTHLRGKYPYIQSVKKHWAVFSDAVHLGFTVKGGKTHAKEIADALVRELIDLRNVTDQEVKRATLSVQLEKGREYESEVFRLHKFGRNLRLYGNIPSASSLLNTVSTLSGDRIRALAKTLFRAPPTLIVLGGNTHEIPSADTIQSQLNKA